MVPCPWKIFLRQRQDAVSRQGLSLEEADRLRPIFEPLLRDGVTGLWNGMFRYAVVKETTGLARQTGQPVFYVEWDAANLGGVNALLGHSGANERFLVPMAQLIVSGLDILVENHGGFHVTFRHGGDEFSSIIYGVGNGSAADRTKPRTLTCHLDTIVRTASAYARRVGLHQIEHPKHKGCPKHRGVGLYYGLSEFRDHPTGWMPPEAMFEEADKRLECYKRGETVTS